MNRLFFHFAAVAVFVFSAAFISRLTTNNNPLDWLPKSHPRVQSVLEEREDRLLKREVLMGVPLKGSLSDPENIWFLLNLEKRLQENLKPDGWYGLGIWAGLDSLPLKTSVTGDVYSQIPGGNTLSSLQHIISTLQKRNRQNPLAFVNVNLTAAWITLEITGRGDALDQRENTLVLELIEVRKELMNHPRLEAPIKLAGFGVVANTFNNLVFEKGLVTLGLSYLVIGLMLYFYFRSFKILMLGLAVLSLSSLSTHAIMASLRIPLNLMTVSVSSLVLILGVADVMHIYNHLKSDSVKNLGSVFVPCLWTSATTAVGFGSLALSDLPILAEFGVAAASGVLAALFWSFYGFYIGKGMVVRKLEASRNNPSRYWGAFLERAQKMRVALPVFSLLLIVASVFWAPKLRLDTNLMSYIPEKDVVLRDVDWFYHQGFATHRVTLRGTSSSPGADSMSHASIQNTMSALKSKGYGDVFLSGVSSGSATFSVGAPQNLSSNALDQWMDGLAAVQTPNTKLEIGGFASLFTLIFKEVLNTQVKSGLLSFGFIFGFLVLFIRNTRLLIFGLIANLMPLLGILCFIVLLDYDLDITAVCVTVLTLGIIVDDTIHLLWTFKHFASDPGLLQEKLKECLTAITATTVILVSGFLVLGTSQIKSLQIFGSVLAVGVFLAWTFDVLIVGWCKKYSNAGSR